MSDIPKRSVFQRFDILGEPISSDSCAYLLQGAVLVVIYARIWDFGDEKGFPGRLDGNEVEWHPSPISYQLCMNLEGSLRNVNPLRVMWVA